jgi:hypothetical protein
MSTIINGTTGVTYPDGVTQSSGTPAPGTSGNVMTSNGTIWTSAALPANPPAFVAGTRMSFQQTAAPTGWTKDTTAAINDSMLRLVTGTASSGGSTAFSTWSAVTSTGSYTLQIADIPSHTHGSTAGGGGVSPVNTLAGGNNYTTTGPYTTTATGGGGGHSHSLTRGLKYYDFIIASKD